LKVTQSGANSVAEFYDSDISGTIPSLIVANNGNVGVGTATPLRTLHVQGDVNFTGALYQNNAQYVSSQWTTGGASVVYYTAGNVGVGTSTPTSALQVIGNVSSTTFSGDGSSLSNLDASFLASGTISSARFPNSGVSAGTYGNGSNVSQLTVNANGIVTGVVNQPIVIPAASVTGLANVATDGDYNSLSNITFTKSGVDAIYTAGNVGIGTTTPLYALHAEGDSYISHVFTTEVTMTSDSNLKANIRTIENSMDILQQLRGVHFEWRTQGAPRESIGLIAQEVEGVLPQVVHQDVRGHKSVSYGNMVGLLIEALKEQQRRIRTLEEKIERMNWV
jgi:hypothetical protein